MKWLLFQLLSHRFFQHHAFLGQKQKLTGTKDMEFRGRISKLVKVKINMQNGFTIWHSLNFDTSNMKHFRRWDDFTLGKPLLLFPFISFSDTFTMTSPQHISIVAPAFPWRTRSRVIQVMCKRARKTLLLFYYHNQLSEKINEYKIIFMCFSYTSVKFFK